MTNRDAVVSALRILAAKQNDTRFGGIARLKIDSPKLEHFLFQDRPRTVWHGGIPNHICAFTDSFDNNHCAAYVYVWDEGLRLKCTLELSNIDSGHREELPYISTSVDDNEIAELVITSLIAGTERMIARGSVEYKSLGDVAHS
jgi:hypothetical protein